MRCIIRLAALLLALTLLPLAALAEGDMFAIGCNLTFEMDQPENDPYQLAELLRGMGLRVQLATFADNYDAHVTLTLDHEPRTATSFHLYGEEAHLAMESSLLGSEMLMFNMEALLEFAMKINNHMGIPVYRYCLLVPFATKDAMTMPRALLEPVLGEAGGTRMVSLEELTNLAEKLAEAAYDDRALSYWLSAIGAETGLDEYVFNVLYSLPEWLEEYASEGISVELTESGAVWSVDDRVLCERRGDSLSLSLPNLPEDRGVAFRMERSGRDIRLHLQLTEADDTVLSVSMETDNLPEHLYAATLFNVNLSVGGSCMADLGEINLHISGYASGIYITDTSSWRTLSILTNWFYYAPTDFTLYNAHVRPGWNVFSVNDSSLKELVSAVIRPAVRGAIPLIAHMPGRTVAALMDLVTDAGLLSGDALASWSEDGGEGGWDEEAGEDEAWDEAWDEEAGEDEAWDEEAGEDEEDV